MTEDLANENLAEYAVHFINRDDGDFIQYFICSAEDAEHAREQCANADPSAIIVEVEWLVPY